MTRPYDGKPLNVCVECGEKITDAEQSVRGRKRIRHVECPPGSGEKVKERKWR